MNRIRLFDKEKQEFEDLYSRVKVQYPSFTKPEFTRELRGSRCAGQAHYRTWKIKINREIHREQFTETLYHEMMHLLSFHLYKEPGHSDMWKYLMLQFGQVPKRTHSFDLIGERETKVKSNVVYCACEKHVVSDIVYKRMKQGREYKCGICKKPLHLSKENITVTPEK